MNIINFNPFEQFMINNNLIFSNVDNLFPPIKLFINNILIIMILIFLLFTFFYYNLSTEKKYYNYNIIIELIKSFYIFIYKNVKTILSKKVTNIYFPFYFFLFLFIMYSNLIGILPYSFAITSHFFITYLLSYIVCFSNLLIGFKINGLAFFSLLFAQGVPFILNPFLILIETISYLFRSISLALRLFANLVAGHILLDTLNLFIFKSIFIKTIVLFKVIFNVVILAFNLILVIFEIFVAISQGYIFVILSTIFSKDIFLSH
uniref:ATP synthase subunit a n=1 Tax=Acrasis kona TaxID=1008807 RepID=A0A0B4MYZ3_9EUKA|nr:ATP synthase F0 subunit 6 [Acrasis kona]AID52030.1 ATP synthase F0 subunit 6 [Acrasis kona]